MLRQLRLLLKLQQELQFAIKPSVAAATSIVLELTATGINEVLESQLGCVRLTASLPLFFWVLHLQHLEHLQTLPESTLSVQLNGYADASQRHESAIEPK